MHFEQIAKILGETIFEAKVKAEKTYGKDNFTVITSKKVKHPIYFGFGHKEMFEITIGINSNKERKNVVTEVPIRPSPSVEVSAPRTSFSPLVENEKAIPARTKTSAKPEPMPDIETNRKST